MNCCLGNPSRSDSLNESPCCDFRMGVSVEPHPARMTTLDSRCHLDETIMAAGLAVAHLLPTAGSLEEPAFPDDTLIDTSPPLFLLNVSLLC